MRACVIVVLLSLFGAAATRGVESWVNDRDERATATSIFQHLDIASTEYENRRTGTVSAYGDSENEAYLAAKKKMPDGAKARSTKSKEVNGGKWQCIIQWEKD
jgi:hypothetical protein